MLRATLAAFALAAISAPAMAQEYYNPPIYTGTGSAWPSSTGGREGATVTTRASGTAKASTQVRGRATFYRRAVEQADAKDLVEKLIQEVNGVSGEVKIVNIRREMARSTMEYPQIPPATSGPLPPRPTTPQQPTRVWQEGITFEVDANSRDAVFAWAAKLPPQNNSAITPASSGIPQNPVYPTVTERVDENDAAWETATRNALAKAERDARTAARAAGGDLGKLVSIWTERMPNPVDGNAQVQVTVEYQIGKLRN